MCQLNPQLAATAFCIVKAGMQQTAGSQAAAVHCTLRSAHGLRSDLSTLQSSACHCQGFACGRTCAGLSQNSNLQSSAGPFQGFTCGRTGMAGGAAAAAARRAEAPLPSRKLSNRRSGAAAAPSKQGLHEEQLSAHTRDK
jgi:hypothetical protein